MIGTGLRKRAASTKASNWVLSPISLKKTNAKELNIASMKPHFALFRVANRCLAQTVTMAVKSEVLRDMRRHGVKKHQCQSRQKRKNLFKYAGVCTQYVDISIVRLNRADRLLPNFSHNILKEGRKQLSSDEVGYFRLNLKRAIKK